VGIRQGALESLAVTAEFWRGRRVLVTGHTGFKGAWLCWWLAHLGAKVAGFALAPPTSTIGLGRACVSSLMRVP